MPAAPILLGKLQYERSVVLLSVAWFARIDAETRRGATSLIVLPGLLANKSQY